MRLGAPILEPIVDETAYVRALQKRGYSAAYCPAYLKSASQERQADRLREALADADIALAEVGTWRNPLSPNPQEAACAKDLLIDRLALADRLHARCCVNIIGSASADGWYAPCAENFSEAFEARAAALYREVIDAVRPTHTRMSFEIMPFCFLDGASAYRRFLHTLDRPQTGVHLDLVNLIHSPRTLYAHRALFEEAVRQLKPDVLSVHVKDIRLDCKPVNTKLDEVELGHGEVDIGHMLSLLAQLDGDVPLMLEHLKSTRAYERAAAYLRRTAREANIQIQ